MKILLVNKFFYRRGGAEVVFFQTADLLRRAGHEVIEFSMQHPQNEPSRWAEYFTSYVDFPTFRGGPVKMARQAIRTIYSREAYEKISRLIERGRPDIAHLHNYYFHLTPSILYALNRAGVPIIHTLHDYHIVCPNHILYNYRKDEICEHCLRYGRHCVLFNGCMRIGRGKSLVAYLEAGIYRLLRTYSLRVDHYIAPSDFLRSKVSPDPVPPEKITALPNPVEDFGGLGEPPGDGTFFYAGRLSREKGLDLILEAARRIPESHWRLAGDGPMEAELRAAIARRELSNVELTGHVEGEALREEYRRARAVVLASRCYENCPLTVLEAMSAGRPTIGARLGGIAELVREGHSGLTFEPGSADGLIESVRRLLRSPDEAIRMGTEARRIFETMYSPEVHLRGLMEIYGVLLSRKPARSS